MLPAIEGGKSVRNKNNFLVFGKPCIGEEEIEEVTQTLRSGWIGTGPKVTKFEELIKNYLGVENTVALNSCTAALHLSMVALGLKNGDEIITTPMTFCATANSIVHAGAKPIFVDVLKDTWTKFFLEYDLGVDDSVGFDEDNLSILDIASELKPQGLEHGVF